MVEKSDSSDYSDGSDDEDFADHIKPGSEIISQTGNDLVGKECNKTSFPTFGNISISDSSDVHFGNKTFYQGPVTIKQIICGNDEKTKILKKNENLTNEHLGLDNPACDENHITNQDNIEKKVDEVELPKYLWLKKIYCNYRAIAIITCVSVVFLSVAFLFIGIGLETHTVPVENQSFLSKSEEDNNTPIKAPTDPLNTLKPMKVKIVSRLEWLAQPPSAEINELSTPVPYVIISHTATENCSSQAQCVFLVRYIQTFHLESRGWSDIGYNFLIGGDREVYFGRGWTKEGAHTYGYNKMSIGISFIGTFIKNKPPEYQLAACKELIKLGVASGYIQQNYKLLGMRQLQTTQSPGEALYKEIQTWDHYSEQP